MTALFDTHTLLWAVLAPHWLSAPVAGIVKDESNELLVSAASAWEISTKVRLGKLSDAEAFEADFENVVTSVAGYTLIPISVEVAMRSGRLPGKHGDPFDRMLAAQALALDIPLLSADGKLDDFGILRIW